MSSVTINILGTAAGVPTVERAHSAVHLNYCDGENFPVLFDCGEGTQRQLMKAKLNYMKIDHVFISHWHGDHCLGLPGLMDTMGFEGREKAINVYGPEKEIIDSYIGAEHSMAGFEVKKHLVPHEGDEFTKIYSGCNADVFSIPADHSIPAVSYIFLEKDKKAIDTEKTSARGLPRQGEIYGEIKEKGFVRFKGKKIDLDEISHTVKGRKIVYSGDTLISENLVKAARGADLLIQDCTYFEIPQAGKHYKHASFPEILAMCDGIKIKQVVLTHVSRKHADSRKIKEMLNHHPGFDLAEDFMVLTL